VSLISEALRKARQQAAEEGDQRRGVLYSWVPATRPRGTRLGLGLVLGATIALGAALAGAGAVWWVVGQRAHSEPVAQAPSPEPAPPAGSSDDQLATDPSSGGAASSSPSAPLAAGRRPRGNERDSPASRTERSTEPMRDAPPGSLTAQSRSTPATDPASTADRTAQPDRDRSDSVTIGPDGERIYLIEADLGGVTLTLDFIVFRPDDPFAEINGLDVHVGSTIEGFTVEAIERNQVRLRNREGVLILRAP
jgi:cytoskeletal protein RodZ